MDQRSAGLAQEVPAPPLSQPPARPPTFVSSHRRTHPACAARRPSMDVLAARSCMLCCRSLFFKREMELALIGLQNAGKTSLVNVIATGSFHEDMIPTVGFNMRKVTKGAVTIKLWDLGGQVRNFDLLSLSRPQTEVTHPQKPTVCAVHRSRVSAACGSDTAEASKRSYSWWTAPIWMPWSRLERSCMHC